MTPRGNSLQHTIISDVVWIRAGAGSRASDLLSRPLSNFWDKRLSYETDSIV